MSVALLPTQYPICLLSPQTTAACQCISAKFMPCHPPRPRSSNSRPALLWQTQNPQKQTKPPTLGFHSETLWAHSRRAPAYRSQLHLDFSPPASKPRCCQCPGQPHFRSPNGTYVQTPAPPVWALPTCTQTHQLWPWRYQDPGLEINTQPQKLFPSPSPDPLTSCHTPSQESPAIQAHAPNSPN